MSKKLNILIPMAGAGSRFKEKGYNIARRTISKYREQLNIPVSRLRKEIQNKLNEKPVLRRTGLFDINSGLLPD